MRVHIDHVARGAALLAVLISASTASAEPAASTSASAEAGALAGLGVGLEIGEPSSLTVGYTLSELGVSGKLGLGSGMLSGSGFQLHADLSWIPLVIHRDANLRIPLRIGLGGRYYRHHYEPASIDELTDSHTGLRVPFGAGVAMVKLGLEVYVEVAPGYDFGRSESCSLVSGAASVCPHTMSSRAFVHGVFGVRYYLGI